MNVQILSKRGAMKIAVIGCGVMGSAFARHFAKRHHVILVDRSRHRSEALAKEIGATHKKSASEAIKGAEIVLLAIKPKDLHSFSKEVNKGMNKKTLISILAGTTLSQLEKLFPSTSVIRIMPNLGFTLGQGVIGIVEGEKKSVVESLLQGTGLVLFLPEKKIEALASLSGSGIGFNFLLIEAMIEAGVYLGFSSREAQELVLKTLEGAIAMVRSSGKTPSELKLQVCSPGGTTIAGIRAMEKKGVRSALMETYIAAYEKSLAMSKEGG
jgi:pyrroline-5-carboxylate reductase